MKVLILGLDTFSHKNVYQLRAMGALGYSYHVLTNDWRGQSEHNFQAVGGDHRLSILKGGAPARLWQAARVLLSDRYAHVELYGAGRLALAYVTLLRALRIPFVMVERGDVGLYDGYDRLTRWALAAAYRHADVVLYKEVYMPAALERFRPRSLAFLPNAVATVAGAVPKDKNDGFLWVNRIIPQRRADWLVRAFASPPLDSHRLTIVGLETRAALAPAVAKAQQAVKEVGSNNIELVDYTEPTPFYDRHSFFCFPAERVFGNHALLEAMSNGLVPVVTEAVGVERVVVDGENGIVTGFTEESYREGLIRAAALPQDEVRRLSANAIETVRRHFSLDEWTARLQGLYAQLHELR